jgi:hypothetical protein
MEVARLTMARREKQFTRDHERLFQTIFNQATSGS